MPLPPRCFPAIPQPCACWILGLTTSNYNCSRGPKRLCVPLFCTQGRHTGRSCYWFCPLCADSVLGRCAWQERFACVSDFNARWRVVLHKYRWSCQNIWPSRSLHGRYDNDMKSHPKRSGKMGIIANFLVKKRSIFTDIRNLYNYFSAGIQIQHGG